jgi:C-terminal processing protease CtpA/Prc
MVVTANGSDALPRGTVIRAIDGEPASAVLASLLPYTRADGTNDAKRVAQLEVRGIDNYETFDIFYGLTRRRTGQPFRLTTDAGDRVVQAIDLKQRQAQITVADNKDGPQWELKFETKDVARLIMPGWAVYNSKWDWKAWLDGVMEELATKQVRTLIVDLRSNEGGLDCGDEILARCIDQPLKRASYERRVRYREAPKELDTYLDTWDPSFKNWGKDAVDIGNGYYRLIESGSDSRAPIMPKGPRFKGQLIVLVSPTNSSATFQFASLVQSSKLGLLVGSPTGGNRRGINGGAFFFLRLPASGLEVDLPLIGTFPATPQPDAGVVPDVTVKETVADIREGVDAVLAAALVIARA